MRGLSPMLEKLVKKQEGAVSRVQLLENGFSRYAIQHRLALGLWTLQFPGVYITYTGEVSRETRWWAALLYSGPDAVLCRESAAEYWEIADEHRKVADSFGDAVRFPKTASDSSPIHVAVPHGRTVRKQDGLKVYRSRRIDLARHPARTMPVTTVEDTVLDLAQSAKSLGVTIGWITRSCQRRKTQPERLHEALLRRHCVRGRDQILAILADVSDGAETPLELAYLRNVERPHGLPEGQRQRHRKVGQHVQWIDVEYEGFRLIVELDGRIGHVEEGAFRDHQRDNASTLEGSETLRYGWTDVIVTPCELAREAATVLTANGWDGVLMPCGPNCSATFIHPTVGG